ncbi:hypothetical protein EDD86DRAFT_189178 [Gorgonomyces haynaldii]|nr:hypothetical protein EDD86DRAFT_189178 [Gorgonomyces haynaldii]
MFLFMSSTLQLGDSFTVSGSPSAIPPTGGSTNAYFNLSTTKTSLTTGEGIPVYMRWFAWDGSGSGVAPQSFTAAFYVLLSQQVLELKLGINYIVPTNPAADAYRNISLYSYKTVNGVKQTICNLTPRRMWIKNDGQDYVVSGRTVLFTLKTGTIVGCDWAPSSCVLSPSSYVLDSICADSCTGGTCGYSITLFISWTGTDAAGNTLQSFSTLFNSRQRLVPIKKCLLITIEMPCGLASPNPLICHHVWLI